MSDPIEQWQEAVRHELMRYSLAPVQGIDSRAGQLAQQAIATATYELVREIVGEDEVTQRFIYDELKQRGVE